MGFDFNNDYGMNMKNGSNSSSIDFNTWILAQNYQEENNTPKFMTFSMILHISALFAVAMMSIPLPEKPLTETITFEIEPVHISRPKIFNSGSKIQARGEKVPPTQGGKKSQEMKSNSVQGKLQAVRPTLVKNKISSLKLPVQKSTINSADERNLSSKNIIAAKTSFKAVPMTIDDIEAPELDQGRLAHKTVKSDFDRDYSEAFDQIDHSHHKIIAKEKAQMDHLSSAVTSSQEEKLSSFERQNAKDREQFSAAQKALQKNNLNTLAQAMSAERGRSGDGNGRGLGVGQGAGSEGKQTFSAEAAGNPRGLARSLDQLRQIPGNPRPQYDREERLRGDQGVIVFFAYVTREGQLSQFKLEKSTGFRNLDAKTLAALKKWKFYLGQEGWVELPFRWDIKGGVQEDGGRLRILKR